MSSNTSFYTQIGKVHLLGVPNFCCDFPEAPTQPGCGPSIKAIYMIPKGIIPEDENGNLIMKDFDITKHSQYLIRL